MPHLIIISGSNGSGKSTAAPMLLQNSLHVQDFVNADTIAQGLCAFQPEKAAIQAGRVMLERIHVLAKNKINFAFETTLASRSFSTWIPKLIKDGYQFHLLFLWLNNPELAIYRVKERVKMGGHHVPEVTVKRRYTAGLKNFFNLYKPLAHSWQLYDNSDADLSLLASENEDKTLVINNKVIWEQLLRYYSEK